MVRHMPNPVRILNFFGPLCIVYFFSSSTTTVSVYTSFKEARSAGRFLGRASSGYTDYLKVSLSGLDKDSLIFK